MTFTAPRIAFSGVRSSFRGLLGAFRVAANGDADYADALLLGRS